MRLHVLSDVLARFRDDRRGSFVVITAVAAVALIGAAALSVDVGTFVLAKRKQQSATDIAAMVAAGHLQQAGQAARLSLVQNGVDPTLLESLEYGIYQADPRLAPDQRFQPSGSSVANAVRVTVKSTAPMFFGSVLFPPAAAAVPNAASRGPTVRTRATAAQADFAAFAIGSRLADLNGGLANALLGKCLGASLSLSIMDYQALASAQFDVFTFSKQLATRAGLSGPTYGQLASASLHLGDVIAALADAVRGSNGSGPVVAAMQQIVSATAGSTHAVDLAGFADFGPFEDLLIQADAPLAVQLSALDAITALAGIAGQGQQITLDLSGVVPSLAAVTLSLAVGQRPVASSFVAAGRTGAQVRTAQTRLLLTAKLQASPPLLSLTVPIYIELASGTASLSSLSCGPGIGTPTTSLDVLPSLVDAWIGAPSNTGFTDFGAPLSVLPAPLAAVFGIPGIYGRAHVTLTNPAPTNVIFSAADITGAVRHTTSTTAVASSLLTSLIGNLQLSLGPSSGVTPLPSIVQSVDHLLLVAAPALDQVIDGILTTLGLRIGSADTWITGVRCGGGVLVN